MPGVNKTYFVLAFDTDNAGMAVPVSEAQQAASRNEAIEFADRLSRLHAGAVAWRQHVETAVGELELPEVVFTAGHVGDFG